MTEMYPLHFAVLIVAGLLGGLFSGMLGVAGVVIMVPVQFWVLQAMGVDPTIAIRMSFGTSLLVVFPTALSSAIAHHRKGVVLWKAGAILGLTGASAAFFGAYFASKFSERFLSSSFGCILILLAIGMLTPAMPRSGKKLVNSVSRFILWGSLFGFVSGMAGVAGGGLMIPIMIHFLGFSVHEAVATSSTLMIFTALGGSVSYMVNGLGIHGLPAYSTGYLNWLQFALLAGSSIPMSVFGAKVAHRLPSNRLRAISAMLLLCIGMKMMGVFSWLRLPI